MPRDTPVREVMTTDVLTFKKEDKVQAAAEAMAARSIGGAPVVDDANRVVGMLRDDELPGPHGLATLAAQFEDDVGVPCTFDVTGTGHDLGSDGRLTLYRVAQEALTNARKHARPQRVEVHLVYEPAGTRLTIEDVVPDGNRPPPGDGTGYGLTGMRERAALLGATLTAEPTGSGFRVELWVPA